MPGHVKQNYPPDYAIAEYIRHICDGDFSDEYIIGEIIKRLEIAREQGADAERQRFGGCICSPYPELTHIPLG